MIDRITKIAFEPWARAQNYLRAWRSPEKIIVIESDDWGAIRTSSREAYQALVKSGYNMDRTCWSADALETEEDLAALYAVLHKFVDIRGCPASITANMVMTNPDFAAIRRNGFNHYCYEPVKSSLESSPSRRNVVQLWEEGMKMKCFRPQFHAREHIRWWQWLETLKRRSPEALETFALNMCGVPTAASKEKQSFFQAVYTEPCAVRQRTVDFSSMIADGIKHFEKQFGFRSLSTIAPNCAWTDTIEEIWAKHGIRYIQGGYCQRLVEAGGERSVPHYLGQRSKHKGWYLVRNCTFEPVKDRSENSWKNCLAEIQRAFQRKIPAVINSHRVNYMGSIIESNRAHSLDQLGRLLKEVITRWPDVQFLSSPELGYMIEHDMRKVNDLTGLEDRVFPPVVR